MSKVVFGMVLCAVAMSSAHAETFVIEADKAGHEATIKVPVGAVTKLSANFAEPLADYAGPQIEAMRLSGDVMISIGGSQRPIEIKADKIVLELTADSVPARPKSKRAEVMMHELSSSTSQVAGLDESRTFVGNVVFNVQTASGPLEIKADRVEHQLTTQAGA